MHSYISIHFKMISTLMHKETTRLHPSLLNTSLNHSLLKSVVIVIELEQGLVNVQLPLQTFLLVLFSSCY